MVSREIMRSTTRNFEKYYNPKLSGELRLDTNTNALGANPAATEALKNLNIDVNNYPNTYSDELRKELAKLYDLDMDNFIVGTGSDEMLDVSYKTFTEWGDKCVSPVPSYSLYNYFIEVNGGSSINVDLTDDFQLDVDAMLKPKAKMIIMPSPNNPTGNSFRSKDIEEILSSTKGIVIVDEAYGEYSDVSMISKINEFDNLIVLRTFSKAYAMSGLRVGYAVGNKNIIDMMTCVKIPYSLNSVSEYAAIAAVKDQDFIKKSVELIKKERPYLFSELKKLGFEPYPSDSNFIMAKSPIDHKTLVDSLKKKGVLIRDFGSKKRTENCVRTTVGTREMNDTLLSKIKEVLKEC